MYGGGVFKSTDGGESWTAINTGLTSTSVNALAITPSTPVILYAGTSSGGRGSVFKSADGGASWTAVNTGLTDTVMALAIDPSEPTTLYAGTWSSGVFKSVNGGASWGAMNTGLASLTVRALAIDPSTPARVYAGTEGGVYEYVASAGPCVPDHSNLCLNGGRFKVTTQWSTHDGGSGAGQAVPLTDLAGYFTFFDSSNVEIVIKVLNGCSVNSRWWTFASGLTDVGVILTVTDTKTSAVQTYTNSQETPFQTILDSNAFATCP
jgi:hypothetical protein